ncbi:MAG: class II glutamine amidotransferase [Synechococcaceae cyanobacterium]
MCELLALNANTPTDMRFSFHGLRLRGGATGDHSDGWGLASFDPDSQGVTIYREDQPAAFSPIAASVAALDLKAHCSIAHIRKATQGVVALENCHPFHRRWQGQEWIFAHNGDLCGELAWRAPFVPEGSTDSEAAFCWMLGELERSHCRGLLNPNDAAAIFQELLRCSRELSDRGSFNALISNGHWLYAYSGTRLHRLTRRAPFRQACLTDDDLSVDFSQLTQPQDVVTVLSTEPLTRDEPWTALQRGEALLLRHGELVQQALPTAG